MKHLEFYLTKSDVARIVKALNDDDVAEYVHTVASGKNYRGRIGKAKFNLIKKILEQLNNEPITEWGK